MARPGSEADEEARKRRWAMVRLALGQLQIVGATGTLYFLLTTGQSRLTIWTALVTAFFSAISVRVFGKYSSYYDVTNESELVGPSKQPEWTTRRPFAETDIYVIPPGEVEFNQFYISSHPREGKPENLFESELEIGLPWRTQLDVEPNYRIEEGRFVYDSTRIEVPHAPADWGKIPLNPALDAGWRFNHEQEDSYLFRVLVADQLGERWHFGANFGFELQV